MMPPRSPIAAHSPKSRNDIALRLKPRERITATSLMRSRTIIAVELAAISNTVSTTTAHSANTIRADVAEGERPDDRITFSHRPGFGFGVGEMLIDVLGERWPIGRR